MSLLDTMKPDGGIPVMCAVFLQPGAYHEGRAKWRPIGKVGGQIAIAWDHLETNRKAAIEYARPRVARIVEAGHEALKPKPEASA